MKKSKGEFHRIRYEGMRDLQGKFDINNLTCGFLREPEYNPITNQMKGFCHIMKEQGVTSQCKRYVPFKAEGCKYYERWRDSKLEEMKWTEE